MKKYRKNSQGFSLIELLVVVTIIALLAAAGLVSYTTATRRARDSRRESDLQQIRTALELFRTDTGAYPANLPELQTGGYVQAVPADPRDPATRYFYTQGATSTEYVLCTLLEAAQANNLGVCQTRSCTSANCNHGFIQP